MRSASESTSPGGGWRALGVVKPGVSLREAILQSRLDRRRFHSYLVWRMARTARRKATANAA